MEYKGIKLGQIELLEKIWPVAVIKEIKKTNKTRFISLSKENPGEIYTTEDEITSFSGKIEKWQEDIINDYLKECKRLEEIEKNKTEKEKEIDKIVRELRVNAKFGNKVCVRDEYSAKKGEIIPSNQKEEYLKFSGGYRYILNSNQILAWEGTVVINGENYPINDVAKAIWEIRHGC